MRIIKVFADGTELARGSGRFDDWCIFVNTIAPKDRDYLYQLLELGNRYGRQRVYDDFMTLFNQTGQAIQDDILNRVIPNIAAAYEQEALEVEKLFSVLYLVLLAEQNRMIGNTPTRLGKTIKALAVHQIFFENFRVEDAASFSYGVPWRELRQLCLERNIHR